MINTSAVHCHPQCTGQTRTAHTLLFLKEQDRPFSHMFLQKMRRWNVSTHTRKHHLIRIKGFKKNCHPPAGHLRQQMLSCSYSMPSLQETSRLDLFLMDPWAQARSKWLLAACTAFSNNKIYTRKKHKKKIHATHRVSINTGFLVNNCGLGWTGVGFYTDA